LKRDRFAREVVRLQQGRATSTGYNSRGMPQLSADSWPGARPQAFASANGTYIFRTRPPQLATWSGKAQGTLLAQSGGETVIWTRELVNIPVRAFIANDGRHVVTFDTWAKLGYEHSLVIYGEQGALVADYHLEALLSASEIARSVVPTATTRPWLKGAAIGFDDSGRAIVITLHSGTVVRVALASGKIESPS
jgi:hypothetical protein